jgi:hypothetical protein
MEPALGGASSVVVLCLRFVSEGCEICLLFVCILLELENYHCDSAKLFVADRAKPKLMRHQGIKVAKLSTERAQSEHRALAAVHAVAQICLIADGRGALCASEQALPSHHSENAGESAPRWSWMNTAHTQSDTTRTHTHTRAHATARLAHSSACSARYRACLHEHIELAAHLGVPCHRPAHSWSIGLRIGA